MLDLVELQACESSIKFTQEMIFYDSCIHIRCKWKSVLFGCLLS